MDAAVIMRLPAVAKTCGVCGERANANAAAVYIINIIYGQGRSPWPSMDGEK